MKTQISMVSTEDLMPKNHAYRHFKNMMDFDKITAVVSNMKKETGRLGFGKETLLLCLMLQFLEDLSDRELERFLQENVTGKWFLGAGLLDKTPDHTTFCKFRNALGTKRMGLVFEEINRQLKDHKLLREMFTFVDATALTSKLNVWEERDKAIQAGYETFNNEVAKKNDFAADKDARFGSKGKNKFWFGYKKSVGVDMQSGMINKVAVIGADMTDAEAGKRVLPKQGMVFADRGISRLSLCVKLWGLTR